MADFTGLKAVFINCSIKKDKTGSHTQRLINRAAGIMEAEGVDVEHIYALDHDIAFGMVKDGKDSGQKDDWPMLHKKVMEADILVLGTPIWLGVKSSVATLVVERMYAYSGDRNEKDQYIYYGKTAGCLITGNEDGAKACAMDMLYAMQHIGYTVPPQADAAWLGEAGPGPSYGDTEYADEMLDKPAGYDNDFTNKNTTYMAWNLMHMAKLLKDNNGIVAKGNTTKGWQHVSNAEDQNPEYR
jgi:multimeric flavodoxin WrbA